MIRYIKYSTSFLLGFLLILIILSNFLHYKIKDELSTYGILTSDMRLLNDTYSLCNVLLKTNPSNENVQSCNFVFKKIKSKINEMKQECPYIIFYTEYF